MATTNIVDSTNVPGNDDDSPSDHSESLSETSSEPSVRVNPAFQKLLKNPYDLLPSTPFKRKLGNEAVNSPKGSSLNIFTGDSVKRGIDSSSTTIGYNANVEVFMKSTLVKWVSAALQHVYSSSSSSHGSIDAYLTDSPLTFQELIDGVALNDLMYDIHPSIACKAGIQALVEDQPSLRLQNLALLLRNIKDYHAEIVGEVLVGRLPDVVTIARDPASVFSLGELKRVLQLLLGCAMKSEVHVRERHVSLIQSLAENDQHEMRQYIEDAKSQMDTISFTSVQDFVHHDFQHVLQQLIDERYDLFEACNSQAVEQLSTFGAAAVGAEGIENGSPSTANQNPQQFNGAGGLRKRGSYHSRQGSNFSEMQQLNLQVADLKNKLSNQDSEIIRKDEELESYSVENSNLAKENKRLKDQLNEAEREARNARGLRDELDIFREKATKADRVEAELDLAKHKLEELEYYRQRLEQSNKDYKMLEETKAKVENHMHALERQVELLHETQRENISLQSMLSNLENQLEEKESQVESLKKENQSLAVQSTVSLNESANLHQQLANANFSRASQGRPSVGSECDESLKFNIIHLENQKQELKTKVTELETQVIHLTKEKTVIEKENEKLKNGAQKDQKTQEEVKSQLNKVNSEKKALHATIEQLKDTHTSEIGSLKEEIESLTQNLEVSRKSLMNDSNTDEKLKEAEEQNILLLARIQESLSKCNQLESEKRQLQRKLEVALEESSQLSVSESKNKQLVKECEQLKHNLNEEKFRSDNLEKLEKENLNFQLEVSKLKGKIDQMSNSESKLEDLLKDNVMLKAQNQKLKASDTVLAQKISQLELENSEKQREIDTLQHVIQVNKAELSRATELEARNQSLNSEIQSLHKTLEMYSEKDREQSEELSGLQLQREAVLRELDTMRGDKESLEVKLKEYQSVDSENSALVKEKRQLERNIERLKRDVQDYESKDQDHRSKQAVLERELKRFQRSTERHLGKDEQIQELKNENAELRKQAMVDKKTNNCLREELVNEKLRHQDLESELEKLKTEIAEKETNWKLQQHKNMLSNSNNSSNNSSPNASFSVGNVMLSHSLLDVKDKRIKELESILAQKSAEKDSIQQELDVLKKQLGSSTSLSPCGLSMPGLDDFNALDREHVRARERIENLTQQLDSRQTEMNELLSTKYRHEGQIEAYRKQLQRTHAETANIQVELSTLRSANASLKAQVADEQCKTSRVEHELNVRNKELDDIQNAHEQLLQNNDMLQALHSNLSRDYEDRMSQFTQLKNENKKLSNNNRDLQDKYDVLKSEKDVLERQNTSLKGQRDALVNASNHTDGYEAGSSNDASYNELEDKVKCLEYTNNTLNRTNASLMEAYEKLKRERDVTDVKRSDVRQLQSSNSELRGQVSNLKSISEQLEILNTQIKFENEMLRSHNDQLSQMCVDYDHLHERLKNKHLRMGGPNNKVNMSNGNLQSSSTTLERSINKELAHEHQVVDESENLLVRTPSFEDVINQGNDMRTKYAELQNHQRRLYENSAYVTASLPQSTTTDSPSMQRKKPQFFKSVRKVISKTSSFSSKDPHARTLLGINQRRGSRGDDESVSVERNNDSSSYGSRSDTAMDSPQLPPRKPNQPAVDVINDSTDRVLTLSPHSGASSNPHALPEEYATLSRKARSKKQDLNASSSTSKGKNKLLSKLSGSGSRSASKDNLLEPQRSTNLLCEAYPHLKFSDSPRKSLPDVTCSRIGDDQCQYESPTPVNSVLLRNKSPGSASEKAIKQHKRRSEPEGRFISIVGSFKSDKRHSDEKKVNRRNKKSSKPALTEDESCSQPVPGSTLKQSRSHPNLRDVINKISTSFNGSNSNLAASFRVKPRKTDRDLPLAHRTTSLERAKAPELSVSIPAFGADHMEPSEQAAVYAYRRRPTGSVSSSGSRPKSAATPASILSGNSANVEQLDEDIDGKISLEQFLRESNRSPKSRDDADTWSTSTECGEAAPPPPLRSHSYRAALLLPPRKYHEAVLNDDKEALREHLSCDELEDEDLNISPVRSVMRQHARSPNDSRRRNHRLSQPSPTDSTFRSDVEGHPLTSSGSYLQPTKPIPVRYSPHSSGNLMSSNIPLTRSCHGNLSGSSIGSDILDRDKSSHGDPSPSKFSTTTTSSSLKHSPQSGSYWGRPGSRSGIVHRSQVTSQSTPKSSSNNRPPSRASNISSSISLQTSKNHSQHMSPSPSPCSVQSSNQSSSSLNNSRSLSNNPRTSKDAVDSAKTKDPPGGDGPPNSSSNSKNGGGSKSAVWYEYGCV